MMRTIKFGGKSKRRNESGQGITEYGFVIAFVCTLIVIAFWIKGNLFGSVSGSYSAVNNNLDKLNKTANQQGGGL
jgi:Flp pilus assembly pilin Flp